MTETTAATKAAPNRLLALWSSVIGKKVVMAVTGAVLILFVIAHMAGNLKIFSGPEEINAYSRFLREVGWPELAITFMKRSTTMAPNRAVFLVGLGNQYRAAGRIQDADAAFERALKLDLNNLEALLSLGEIRFDEGQLEWTRVLADRALQLAPQDARVHALIGKLLNAER